MECKLRQLKSGLKIVLVPKVSTEVLTVMVMFKVGSRQESRRTAGISHVLEHMHFKGTKKRRTAMKLSEFIESVGGINNAFTAKEYTGYYTKLTPKHIPEAFDFLSDILTESLFDKDELKKEKKVILQEINMYKDLPIEMAAINFEEAVFGRNALGRDIIGYKKSVKSVTRASIIEHRDKYYKANNAVLVLAGNLGNYSEKEILHLAERNFVFADGAIPEQEEIKISQHKKPAIIEKKQADQSHLVIGFETVSYNHPDFFALELLSTVLGGSMSSRMFEELREKRGLAYYVKTITTNFGESGVLYTQAAVDHKKTYEAIEVIMDTYSNIKKDSLSKTELNKAKEIISGTTLIRFEDSEELAHHYATEVLLANKIMTPKELIAKYQEITPDEVIDVAKKYLIPKKMTLSFIGERLNRNKIDKVFKLS